MYLKFALRCGSEIHEEEDRIEREGNLLKY